jgi:hypothetical protein
MFAADLNARPPGLLAGFLPVARANKGLCRASEWKAEQRALQICGQEAVKDSKL